MIPQLLGGPARPMVGILHPPADPRRDLAILLCNPIGQESIRTAVLYRTLAARAARAGIAALRFDYHGCGDSPGRMEEQSLSDWCEDLLAAHRALASLPHRPRIAWFGLGLGANLACSSVMHAHPAPVGTLLWDPVTDGKGYLAALCDAHRRELEFAFGMPWRSIRRLHDEPEPELPGVVLGFEYGGRLVDEIGRSGSADLSPMFERCRPVVCGLRDGGTAPPNGWPSGVRVVPSDATEWMNNAAMGTAIVPQDVQRAFDEFLDSL